MILECARLAISQLFEAQFRAVMWKSLGLTIVLLLCAWFGMEAHCLASARPGARGLAMGDNRAGVAQRRRPVRRRAVPDRTGDRAVRRPVPRRHCRRSRGAITIPTMPPERRWRSCRRLSLSLKFLVVVVAANLVALLLVLLPGINFAIFFLVNGYLLGREYFQFAAMRLRSEADANRVRRHHATTVFLAGLVNRRFHGRAATQPADAGLRGGADGASAQAGQRPRPVDGGGGRRLIAPASPAAPCPANGTDRPAHKFRILAGAPDRHGARAGSASDGRAT